MWYNRLASKISLLNPYAHYHSRTCEESNRTCEESNVSYFLPNLISLKRKTITEIRNASQEILTKVWINL